MCRGIFSHALYAEGSDLRHSSGNLCSDSCGLIRLCMDLEDNTIPGITRGSNPLHTSNQLWVYIYAHAIHFLCAFVHLSTCIRLSVFLLSQHACSCLNSFCMCVCVCEIVRTFMRACVQRIQRWFRVQLFDGWTVILRLYASEGHGLKGKNPDFTLQPYGVIHSAS